MVGVFIATILIKLIYFNKLIGGRINSFGFLMSLIGALMIISCLVPVLPKRWRIKYIILVNILITLMIISNQLFYRYFNDIITLPIVTQIKLVGPVYSSIFNLFSFYDLLYFSDFLLLILLPYIKKSSFGVAKNHITSMFICFAFFIAGLLFSYYGIYLLDKYQPKILTTFYDKSYIAQHIGLINYHAIDAFKYVKEELMENKDIDDEDIYEIGQWFIKKNSLLPDEPNYFGVGKGKNLIVIQVEALQEFVIGKEINGMEITPNLNRLINRSIYFNNFYCQTAAGGTSDAEFLANTSLYPLKSGAVYMKYPGNYYYSLAKVLKEKSYQSFAMHAYKPGFWNRSVMYPSLGFDKYLNKNDYEHDEIIGMGLSDKSFFSQSMDYLKKAGKPYYAFIVTLTSHYPYNDTKAYKNALNVGKLKGSFLGNYLEAIHYVDSAIGYIIKRMEEEDLMEDTVLVIYGDHHAVSKDRKDELADFLKIEDMNNYMWVKHQKVPFIIHLPEDRGAGIVDIAGGGIDIMPTILNIMGIHSVNIPMMGRDLLNSNEGLAIMRNGYFIDDNHLCLTADGVAYNVKNGENYPIENLESKIEKVFMELDISQKIIENNLIKDIIEILLDYNNQK